MSGLRGGCANPPTAVRTRTHADPRRVCGSDDEVQLGTPGVRGAQGPLRRLCSPSGTLVGSGHEVKGKVGPTAGHWAAGGS